MLARICDHRKHLTDFRMHLGLFMIYHFECVVCFFLYSLGLFLWLILISFNNLIGDVLIRLISI